MFANAAARKGMAAAQAKLERVGRVNWRTELLEGSESVPLPSSRGRDDGKKPASRSAVAARTAFIKVVVNAAKLAYAAINNPGQDTLNELVIEAYELAIRMIEPYTRRSKESQHNAMVKMLSRGSLGSGAVMRGSGSLVISMVSLLKECRQQYVKLTGNLPSLQTMPNFIRHLGTWASASIFLGEFGQNGDTMTLFEPGKPESGQEILLSYRSVNGSVIVLKGVYIEEKLGSGKDTITVSRFTTKQKWLAGDVSTMENIVSFMVTKQGDEWSLISTMGHSGMAKVIGINKGKKAVYHDMWMDANAIPPTNSEVMHLMAEYWEREMDKRRTILTSVSKDIADRLVVNFREHNLDWFFNTKLVRARGEKQASNPFHGVSMSEWSVVVKALNSAGLEVALALIKVEETMDVDQTKLDADGVITIWEKAFQQGGVSEWKKYKELQRADVKEARDKKEKVKPFDMNRLNAGEKEVVERISRLVESLRRITAASNLPSVRFALQGINQCPTVAAYIAQVPDNEDFDEEEYRQWCRDNNLGQDVAGDKNYETGSQMVRRLSGGDLDVDEEDETWEDLTGEKRPDDEEENNEKPSEEHNFPAEPPGSTE
nr:nucleoprotein [Turtle fraservirus 1]